MPERPELDVVRRFYAEAINGRDSSACERLLGEQFVHNGERRAVLRVDDGLIVEAWDKVDLFGLFSQIGMSPAAD